MAISYVGAGADATQGTSGSDIDIPYPSGLAAGDLLLIFAGASVSSTWATNAATGFTRRVNTTSGGSSPVQAAYYKVASGSETGNITVNSPGGVSRGKMLAFRGVDTTTPFDTTDALFGSSVATTAYDIPSQTTTMVGCTLVLSAIGNTTTGSMTGPANYTEINDAATVIQMATYYRIWSGSGETGVRGIVRAGSVRGNAIGVALRPYVPALSSGFFAFV